MKKLWIVNLFLTGVMILAVIVNGCGSVSKVTPVASAKVSGVAATGAPVHGTVTLKDSSMPSKGMTATTAADGSFSFTVGGLQPPYVLRAAWNGDGSSQELYALADGPGTTNINPLTNAAFVAAANVADPAMFAGDPDASMIQAAHQNMKSVMEKLKTKLAQLFALYGVTQDPEEDEYEADHTGLDALFDDITIKISDGQIIVTNKQTGGVIFKASVNDIDHGTFYPENMPGQPGQVDGAALYAANCSSCHGPLASSSKAGASAAAIQSAIQKNTGGMGKLSTLTALQIQAIAAALAGGGTTPPPPTTPPDGAALYSANCAGCHGPLATSSKLNRSATAIASAIQQNIGGMGSLSGLTSAEIQAIATALAGGGTTPPPPAQCTYTYSAWGACQADSTQSRSLPSSTPAGCTGTPVLTQSCTYTPPQPQACTYTYSAWGACQAYSTQSRSLLSSTPAGCTGTPVLSQSCTYTPPQPQACTYTYSAWSACQADSTQTRTVLTSLPAGCTGTPVLSQSCAYTPPIDGAALYTQYCSGCHGNAKKGKSVTAITNAINSNTGGMGSLSFLTPAQIQAISTAP